MNRHTFKASEDDADMCAHCGKHWRNTDNHINSKSDPLHPLFAEILFAEILAAHGMKPTPTAPPDQGGDKAEST